MNFARSGFFTDTKQKNETLFIFFIFLTTILFYLAGCGENVRLPSTGELAEFEAAGPIRPTVDVDRLVKAKIGGGPYRVVPGDVLELTMPTILQTVTAEMLTPAEKVSPFTPYLCRVGEEGMITLPIVSQLEVAGKTLAEIESAIIDVYYPKYVGTRPSVLVRVAEYKTAAVSITGAVQQPGVYELRSDRMSLVALLMEAGGIADEGAAAIRIIHAGEVPASVQNSFPGAISGSGEKSSHPANNTANTQPPGESAVANSSGAAGIAPRYLRSDKLEVELTFNQAGPSSTKGELLVKYDDKVQAFINFDIANPLHRQTVARLLAEKDPRFATVKMEPELSAMAEHLQAISARSDGQEEVEKTDTTSAGRFDVNNAEGNFIPDEVLYKQALNVHYPQARTGHEGKTQHKGSSEPVVLPVRGLNIPFADIALADGDSVVVEPLELPMFTVIGLVNKPGNFPYPPDIQYNLMQAFGFAGGLDRVAEPRYATVYRLKPDGEIVHATFGFRDKSGLTATSNVLIKPGDIVAVEHTPKTRTRVFLDKIFRISLGAYVPLYVWGR